MMTLLRARPHILSSRYCINHHHRSRTSLRAFASSPAPSHNDYPLLKTSPVPEVPPALAASPTAFLEYLRSPLAAPFVLRSSPSSLNPSAAGCRAETLLRTLRAADDRLVEVEVGRYDRAAERVDVPLGVYLDWLTGALAGSEGEAERMQLYLAQWRARDEVPGLAELVQAPSLLAPLLECRAVDLYQTSFFVGPSATVTPLHYDPYFNLYNVYASSDPEVHAKHFVLLPPALSEYVSRADGSVLRNTSPVDLHLRKAASASENGFEVAIDPTTASMNTRNALAESGAALSCILHEGDTLFVPRKWWHRVENVCLRQDSVTNPATATTTGWTAGVGWWFLPRNS